MNLTDMLDDFKDDQFNSGPFLLIKIKNFLQS